MVFNVDAQHRNAMVSQAGGDIQKPLFHLEGGRHIEISITFVRVKLVNDYYRRAKYIPYKVANDKTLCILQPAGLDGM